MAPGGGVTSKLGESSWNPTATYPNGNTFFGILELGNILAATLLLRIVEWPETAHHLDVALARVDHFGWMDGGNRWSSRIDQLKQHDTTKLMVVVKLITALVDEEELHSFKKAFNHFGSVQSQPTRPAQTNKPSTGRLILNFAALETTKTTKEDDWAWMNEQREWTSHDGFWEETLFDAACLSTLSCRESLRALRLKWFNDSRTEPSPPRPRRRRSEERECGSFSPTQDDENGSRKKV